MGKIAIHRGQYETYRLIDNMAQAYLEVVPERGGMITHWHYRGRDLLYLDSERFSDPSQSLGGGIPVLFPICGNLPNHTYRLQGQSYQLQQHGFARDLPWQVVETRTQDSLAIVLRLESSVATRALYPFEFVLTLTYSLNDNQLTLGSHLENHSPEAMPFCLGFHPYFPVPDKSQLRFELPATQLIDQITQEHQPFFGQFDFGRDELDLLFPELAVPQAVLEDQRSNHRWILDWSDGFKALVFGTVKGKDSVCLAPRSSPHNALGSGQDFLRLPPGSSYDASFRLAIQLGDRWDGPALVA